MPICYAQEHASRVIIFIGTWHRDTHDIITSYNALVIMTSSQFIIPMLKMQKKTWLTYWKLELVYVYGSMNKC
jgi:hypothetical protein